MPSDAHTKHLAAVAKPSLEGFRSSLATTIAQLQSLVAELEGDEAARSVHMAEHLGAFAQGRVNPNRFAQFAQGQQAATPAAAPVLQRAIAVLQEVHQAGTQLTHHTLQPGKNLRCLLSHSLRQIGRAFGAARVAQLATAGCFDEREHAPLLDQYLFRYWGPEQRKLAPMLVIHIEDGDVQATNLGEFLDGAVKVILNFGNLCSAAPLARLISPGVFVVQTTDPQLLAEFAAWDGPGVAAIVPQDCAQFVHNPLAGTALHQRLNLLHLPSHAPKHAFGGLSLQQQMEDVHQLQVLAKAAESAPASEEASPARPVDKLAALLLNKAHLEEV